MNDGNGGRRAIAIVGAGPAGVLLLERIIANAPVLAAGASLRIDLVDPYPPGGGRVWRQDQPELLWMNSLASDVSMFTDDTVVMDGPVRPGPSLHEWSASLEPASFASRRTQSEYLAWCFARAVAAAGEVTVRTHQARAVALTEDRGRQRVWLEGRPDPLDADLVVLAQGHLDAEPDGEHRRLADHAREHGLAYLPPHYAADADLDRLEAGEAVLVRGMGLGFIDDMALLTEGRGGRYRDTPDGPVYLPSGREPVLYVTSRRGVPYQSKVTTRLHAPRPAGPRYLSAEAVTALHAQRGPLSLERDLAPLIAKELGWQYYRELFLGHPDRVTLPWGYFQSAYDTSDKGELADVVTAAVPRPQDRFDLPALLDPLAGRVFTAPALTSWMHRYITGNVRRHADPAHSADLALTHGMVTVFGALALAQAGGLLSARAQAVELTAWAQSVFSYCASGPPPRRLLELVALSKAGVVRFLGAADAVTAEKGRFHAVSASVPGLTVAARALVEARLPEPTVRRTLDPLLRALYRRGEIAEETLAEPGGGAVYRLGRVAARGHRLLDAAGNAHPRRFGLGYGVGGAFVPVGFGKPQANGVAFRNADSLARRLLTAPVAGG